MSYPAGCSLSEAAELPARSCVSPAQRKEEEEKCTSGHGAMSTEQEYSAEFISCILVPAVLSIAVSALVLVNFFVVSTHLQGYIYHQISTFFAFCDIIGTTGTLLASPHLFDTRRCIVLENLFLSGSFMKVMAVLFNTCLIYYVLVTSSVPSVKAVSTVVAVTLTLCSVFIFFIIYNNAAHVLCFDPVAGSFSPSDVSDSEFNAFIWGYWAPISASFVMIIGLMTLTYVKLHTVFNAALLYLLHRLLPYPLILSFAFLPSSIFQLIYVLSEGKRVLFLKRLGLVGIHISGALFGIFYFYVHVTEVNHNSDARQVASSSGSSRSSRRRDLSWTTSGHSSSSSNSRLTETVTSEQELSPYDSQQRYNSFSIFSRFSSRMTSTDIGNEQA